MVKFLLALIIVAIVMMGCTNEGNEGNDRNPPTTSKTGSKLSDESIFIAQDTGEKVKLLRQAAGARNASGYSEYNDYNYGYGVQNPFLAFADYVHWLDYSLTSVVKFHFGPDPGVIRILQYQQSCWNFTITSSNPITIQRIDQRATAGYGSMTEIDQNRISVQWAVGSARGGLVFGVHSNDSSTCNSGYGNEYDEYYDPNWYHSGYDPYQYGYNGNYRDMYYYYPANPCAYRHQQTTLRVSGTVSACSPLASTSEGGYPGQAQYFDVDLSYYVNSSAGYMPYFNQSVVGGEIISGRAVSFDGQNWY